jgi:anaerobic selenocysteine-containing dehydrogenase
MMTIRSHNQFNTTVYDHDDRYRGIYGYRRVILMNREDMQSFGISEGEPVTITSHFHGETRTAPNFLAIPYEIPKRCAATYFPEANVLVPVGHYAEKSRTPVSKSLVISVERTTQ